MLTYRTFRNTDPPLLADLWQSRAGQPGLVQPVSPDLLEQLVFAKLYFDYGGLLLALDDGRPVGFAHAGFGPNLEESWFSTEAGVTCVVLVRPDCAEAEVAAGLLDRCEEYLRRRGAKVLYGGGFQPLDPFYLGLYGGSELPGVLDSDVRRPASLRRPRLPRDRADDAHAARTERVRVGDRSAADAGAPADDGGGDRGCPHAHLVGGVYHGRVRPDAIRPGAAGGRIGHRHRHIPQHGTQRHGDRRPGGRPGRPCRRRGLPPPRSGRLSSERGLPPIPPPRNRASGGAGSAEPSRCARACSRSWAFSRSTRAACGGRSDELA